MNRKFTLLFLFLVSGSFAQGILKESLRFRSNVLNQDVEYSLYLPADYDQSARRYPVLYLLHGYSDDETGWTQFGEVKAIADRQMAAGEMTSMIIVMPDAGVSWYINSYDGKVKYEDFFIQELIPFIDKTLRTRTDRQYRAVAGLSMGGMGTGLLATKHPDLFSAAAPLSAAVWTDEQITAMPDQNWNNALGLVYGRNLKGAERINAHYRQNALIHVVRNSKPDELKKVAYYVDCGDKDFLIEGNMALHAEMIRAGIPHEFRVREGVHDWTYWRTALPEVLRFVTKAFHR